MRLSEKVKKEFPILQNQPDLCYLDSSATSLKPHNVVDREKKYYENYTSNIGRGLYRQALKTEELFWQTRCLTAKLIGASNSSEVVFTAGATDAVSLVAGSLRYGDIATGFLNLSEGSSIVVSVLEHHSNMLPWQLAISYAKKYENSFDGSSFLFDNSMKGFRVINIADKNRLEGKLGLFTKDDQKIDKSLLSRYIDKGTKILAITLVSNVLGNILPVRQIISLAKEINPQIVTFVDGAQAVPHMPVDVRELGCDFLTFSAHKMLGPTGVGVLWGRRELLDKIFPVRLGGGAVSIVEFKKFSLKDLPERLEAGTPNIAGVIGFGGALKYLADIGLEDVRKHEEELIKYAISSMEKELGSDVIIYGNKDSRYRGGVLSFNIRGVHPHDVAEVLAEENIAIRAGHHCAMPLHKELGINASCRASFYIYNDEKDVERLIRGLKRAKSIIVKM